MRLSADARVHWPVTKNMPASFGELFANDCAVDAVPAGRAAPTARGGSRSCREDEAHCRPGSRPSAPARIRSCAGIGKAWWSLTGERTDRYRFMVFPKQHSRRSTRADARHIDLEYERIPSIFDRCTASCSAASPCGPRSPSAAELGRCQLSTRTSSACRCARGVTMRGGIASIIVPALRRLTGLLDAAGADRALPRGQRQRRRRADARRAPSARSACCPLSAHDLARRQLAHAARHHGGSHRHARAGAHAAPVRELPQHVQRGGVVARRHDGARRASFDAASASRAALAFRVRQVPVVRRADAGGEAASSPANPSARVLPTSSSLRGVPSGLLRSNTSVAAKADDVGDRAREVAIVTSSPQPTLMISGDS